MSTTSTQAQKARRTAMSHQYQPSSSGTGDSYAYGSSGGYGSGAHSYGDAGTSDPYGYQPAGGAYDGGEPYGYGPPQSYGQPGYAQLPPQNTAAMLSLILSLVGFATGGTTSIAGIVLGHIAKSQIKRTGERGDEMATWGLITGYVITGLYVLLIGGYLIFVFLLIGAGVMTGG